MKNNPIRRIMQSFILILCCAFCSFPAYAQAANAKPNYEIQVWPACLTDDNGQKAQAINNIFLQVEQWPAETIFTPSEFMGKIRSEKDVDFYATWNLNQQWSERLNDEIYALTDELTPKNYHIDNHIFESEIIRRRPGTRTTPDGRTIKGYYITAKAHLKTFQQYNPYISHEVLDYYSTVTQKTLADGNLELSASTTAYVESTESIDVKIGRAHSIAVHKAASILADAAVKANRCSRGKRKELMEEITKRYRQGGMVNTKGCGVDAQKIITIVLDEKGNLVIPH